MTARGDYPGEMDTPRRDDQSLEGLLSEGTRRFVERLPDAYGAEIAPDVATRHLAAIGEQVRALGTMAATPAVGAGRTPFGRSRAMLGSFLATLMGKIALGAAVAVAATGGLAATGNLPAPVQTVAVSAAVHVGVHLPDPNDGAKVSEGRQDGEHPAEAGDGHPRSPKPTGDTRRGADKFELRGVVQSVRGGASSGTSDEVGDGSDGHTAPAPGAMSVSVKGVSQAGDACGVKRGKTAAVRWTQSTRFSPASVVDDAAFPSNLIGKHVQAGGAVVRATGGGCTLVASHVEVAQGERPGSPDPFKSPELRGSPKPERTSRPELGGAKSPDPARTPKPGRIPEPKDDHPGGVAREGDGVEHGGHSPRPQESPKS